MNRSPSSLHSRRTAAYQPALAWFTAIGGAWVFVLVLLGAFTTTIGAGMVFKSWPLSDGSLNPNGWLSDINKFAEHAHRLSAGLMGMIGIVLAIWIWLTEARAWVRKLAVFAVVLVFTQALVGGLRVRLEPEQVAMISTSVGRLFAMLHACLAQIYVCTLLALALSLSRPWLDHTKNSVGPGVRRIGVVCCALLLVQLGVAAVMRHSFAWHTILTFPAATPDGKFLPPEWNILVAIQFTHTRIMATLLSVALPIFAIAIWRDPGAGRGMKGTAGLLVALLTLQITLGAFAIWKLRSPGITTAHVMVGACTLATAFGLTWWAHRGFFATSSAVLTDAAVSTPAPTAKELVHS